VRRRLIPLLLALALAACGRETARDSIPPPPAAPERVICASPAVAEIVFALGAGDQVVGVSAFTDRPPEAAAKPVIGGALAPNRERILALDPDLILSQGRSENLSGFAREHGIAFRSLPLDTLADLRDAIAACATILGREETGRRILREMDTGFASLPTCEPVPVFIALGHAPGDLSGLMTTGPGTFLHELVECAGGRNLFADARVLWPRISRESLVRRNPDLLLDIQALPLNPERRAALIADWTGLGFDPARVRIVEDDRLLRPGPQAPEAAARLSKILHSPPAP